MNTDSLESLSRQHMDRVITKLGGLIVGKDESAALRDRLISGAGGLFVLRIVFSALSFAGNILLARLLGKEQFGVYVYCFSWLVLIGIPAILGLDQRLVRDIAVFGAKREFGRMRGLLQSSTIAVCVASVTLGVLAGTTAWLVLRSQPQDGLLPTFLLAMTLLPLVALTRLRQAAMQGLHRVALGAVSEQVIQPGVFLVLVALVYLHPAYELKASVAMGLTLVGTAAAFVVGGILLYRHLPPALKNTKPVYADLDLVQSTLPLLFISGANVLFGQADTLILGLLKGPASVGIYSVAHRNADFISFVLNVQVSAFASTAASLYAIRDLDHLQRLITKLARWTLLAAAPLGFVLIVFGRWILGFYGPQFVEAQTTLVILVLTQIFNVAAGVNGLLLVVTGHERDAAAAIGGGAAANIVASFALCPRWGSEGAAVAFAISMVVWNVWMLVTLYRKVGIDATVLGKWRGFKADSPAR
jgi:O-antigen/teichoic acid export membrane protein